MTEAHTPGEPDHVIPGEIWVFDNGVALVLSVSGPDPSNGDISSSRIMWEDGKIIDDVTAWRFNWAIDGVML